MELYALTFTIGAFTGAAFMLCMAAVFHGCDEQNAPPPKDTEYL